MFSQRLFGLALAAAALSPAFLEGCSSTSGGNPLCCTEFAVGATVNANIGGSAQSQVAVQAVADLGGIAASAVEDLTSACRGIAQDLDAAQADQDAASSAGDANAVMKQWCSLAVKQIASAKGSASLTIAFQPPVCEASISAKADCQAKCSGGVKCDLKANPPKCTGGTLSIDCKGGCTGSATAPTIQCTGSCSGSCTGSCTGTASAAVDCDGKCDGTCAAGGSANGTGIQADGSCKGTCTGKCTLNASAKVSCKGSCDGSCDAKCTATPGQASVKCSGTCDADYQPLSCSGGKLEGGCTADAKCDANCNASVQAKASCSPPQLTIAASTTGIEKLVATLEAHLPAILGIRAKFQAMGDLATQLSGNVSAVADIKAACIPAVVSAVGQAATDVGDSLSASVSVAGSVGVQ